MKAKKPATNAIPVSTKFVMIDKTTGRRVIVDLKDVAPTSLYDTKTIPSTANTTVSFFSNLNRSDEISTNMLNDNTLPIEWKFICSAIRFVPDFNARNTDIAVLGFWGILTFKKGGQTIFKAPASLFNAGAGDPTAQTNGYPSTKAVMRLPMPFELKGGENFEFEYYKSKSTSANINAKVVLDGVIYRNIATY